MEALIIISKGYYRCGILLGEAHPLSHLILRSLPGRFVMDVFTAEKRTDAQ